jgi:hypothetical protein
MIRQGVGVLVITVAFWLSCWGAWTLGGVA